MWEKFIAWLNGMDPGVIKTSILAIAANFSTIFSLNKKNGVRKKWHGKTRPNGET